MEEKSSGDTWSDIQAFKSRQNSLREKLKQRKKDRDLVLGIASSSTAISSPSPSLDKTNVSPSFASGTAQKPGAEEVTPSMTKWMRDNVEKKLLQSLCDAALKLPIDSRCLLISVTKSLAIERNTSTHLVIQDLLEKFALQGLIRTVKDSLTSDGETCTQITSADHSKLTAFDNELSADLLAIESKCRRDIAGGEEATDRSKDEKRPGKRPNDDEVASSSLEATSGKWAKMSAESSHRDKSGHKAKEKQESEVNLESLLSLPSIREKEEKKMGEEILELLSKPTAKERSLVERFRSVGGGQVQEFCAHGTSEECLKVSGGASPCSRLHFKKILEKHTDEALGDCSFLNTCFHMDTCKYVHYQVDYSTVRSPGSSRKDGGQAPGQGPAAQEQPVVGSLGVEESKLQTILYPAQWIQSDLRFFDMSILGKNFAVVMADPPWDIHMELPYGTMSDEEMRKLSIPSLQEEGLIFLWVTGRAMELGRECLKLWGYQRCDEIIWVKTNQLQRIIRTGRTGHWLNHGKEHCLVGIKGQPNHLNRGLDCDVIVAEVRATSHKPDEIYGIIERLSPGTKKIELFGRSHNIQPNWITLGNQVDGVRLLDPELIAAFKKRYPDGDCMKKSA